MNTIKKAIRQFMDNHLNYYSNQYDVEFIMFEDNSICVCGTWWVDEANDINYIDLAIDCKFNEFVKLFGITSLTQHLLLPKLNRNYRY